MSYLVLKRMCAGLLAAVQPTRLGESVVLGGVLKTRLRSNSGDGGWELYRGSGLLNRLQPSFPFPFSFLPLCSSWSSVGIMVMISCQSFLTLSDLSW